MRTYTEVFRAPEFTSLFVSSSLQVAASTVSGLALGTYVYAVTGAPLLAALVMFGPSLAQLIGATALLSAADRLPPRATMTFLAIAYGLGTAAQAIPGMPIAAIFAIALVLGALNALGGGVRYGLLIEILPAEGYLLGRSVLNMAVGIFQITGFAVGGVLVTALSPRGTLLAGTALYLASAAAARWGLRHRPPRASGRPSVAQTMRTNRLLWSSVPRRYVYLGLWVPNGLIVGCEALFVPYSTRWAGLLLSSSALGMLGGDLLVGRFLTPTRRRRLIEPLRLLLAGPYLLFGFALPVWVAAALVVLASVGYASTLLLQEQLLAVTPPELSGHALGLSSSGMLTMQAVGAVLAGALATQLPPGATMACLAVASTLVTLVLTPGLRAPVRVHAAQQ